MFVINIFLNTFSGLLTKTYQIMRRSTIIGCFVGLLSLTINAQATLPKSQSNSGTTTVETQKKTTVSKQAVSINNSEEAKGIVSTEAQSAAYKQQFTPLFVASTLKDNSEEARGIIVTQENRAVLKQHIPLFVAPVARTAEEEAEILGDLQNRANSNKQNNVVTQNRTILSDIIPTAGATEIFNPAVGDNFYDPGGPGGMNTNGSPGNYPNCGCDTQSTLAGVSEIEFLDFGVNGNFDYLRLYDGTDATGTVLYDNSATGANNGEKTLADMIASNGSATFTSTSGNFFFFFHASTVVNWLGWDVEIVTASGGGGGGMACSQAHPFGAAAAGGSGSSVDSDFKTASDIVVPAGEDFTIDTIEVPFLTFAPLDPPTTAVVVYHEDAGGLPGAVIGTETVVPTILSSAPWANPVAFQFMTSLALTPFTFPGDAGSDTTYWIEISMGTATNQPTVFWEYSNDIPVEGFPKVQFDASVGTWAVQDPLQEVIYTYSGQCDPIGGGGMACSQAHPFGAAAAGGSGSSVDSDFKTASDIVVSAGEDFTIDTIEVPFLTFAPLDPPTTAVVVYHEDAGGLPGAVIGTETVVPTILSSAPWANPVAFQFMTSLALTPFTFPGDAGSDTTYWIEISMGTATNQPTVFWEYSNDIPVEGFPKVQFDASVGTWAVQDPLQEVIYTYSGQCDPIGGGGTCVSTAYDSTAVPFDIDGAGNQTTDCTNAPNLIPITVADAGIIGTDADLENITIDIVHTFTADLDLYLVSPNGTELLLANDLGGGIDNGYNGTMFEDGGADITLATAPFGVGPYEPMGGTFAAAFAGEDITGDWNLKVCDDAGGDTGQVIQFSMSICVPDIIVTNNDDCSGAISLACGDSVTGETLTATDSGGNPAPDVFYKYTGTGTPELVTISLCAATDYDSLLRVFDDCDLLNELAVNDDFCGLQSEVTFSSDGTSTYYIMVEGFGSNSGNFSLDVSCEAPLVNDDCSGAIAVSCGDSVTGSTDGATIDTAATCGTPITSPGVWYKLNDNSGLPGDITLSLCNGTDFDSKISVYSGTCAALVCIDGNDDACGLQSEISFASDGNTEYYILIHGFGGATGNFTMDVTCTPTPPPNDMIVNSIDVDEIGFPYTDPAVAMPAATPENGNPVNCDLTGANGVWYNFVAGADGTANAMIVTPGGASSVTFYTAPDENAVETDLTLVPQQTNQCGPGTSASIFTLGGQAYYVFVLNSGAITDIVIDGTNLGVSDNTIAGFSYYPNPTNGILNLKSVDNIEHVSMYNLLGQMVIDNRVEATTSQVDISGLSTGTYLMKVTVNGETGTYKVLKQ